ncbi:hypothetical protein CL634_07220 [bacterium]|nr:hypothetical protein [bacterium]
MFQLLFQNLFKLHKRTQLLEIFDWDEEALETYTASLSKNINEFKGESVDDLMELCLDEAAPFILEFNKNQLKEFLEDEFSTTLREITAHQIAVEN